MSDGPEMIGVLVDELDGEYQIAVVGGVVDAARGAGVNLVVFAGGVLGPRSASASSATRCTASPRRMAIDGLVMLSGTVANYRGLDDLVLPEGETLRSGVEADGFLAMLADNTDLVIRAGSGRFSRTARPEQALDADEMAQFAPLSRGEPVSWPELPG